MFLPENIDLAFSEKYILSIRLLPDGFSFSIHCPSDAAVFCHNKTTFSNKISYLENIKKLIFDFSFFTQTFQETRVITVSPEYTLVPECFFEKKMINDFLTFNIQYKKSFSLSQPIPEIKANIVFDMDEEIYSFLSRNLWNPVFSHHIKPLLTYSANHENVSPQKRCYVSFHDQIMDICCFQENTLFSANTYILNDRFDALYYISGVWEKLEMDQATDKLYIIGNGEEQKETLETLTKLIRQVEVLAFLPQITISEIEKSLLPSDLLIQLCAL